MTVFDFNDRIRFMLPDDFTFERQTDDEGIPIANLMADRYVDENGETSYRFRCTFSQTRRQPSADKPHAKRVELEDQFRVDPEKGCTLKLSGTPETLLGSMVVQRSLFGMTINVLTTIAMVRVSDWDIALLTHGAVFINEDPDEIAETYQRMYQLLSAIRVDGKGLPLGGMTAARLQQALEPTMGDHSGSGDDDFAIAEPDESLYPHYEHHRSAGGLGFPGVVQVGTSGTDYQFIPLSEIAADEDAEDSFRAICNRAKQLDIGYYDLDQKARSMMALFRVSASAFNPRNDRECEIDKGLLRSAYLFSALRSFAWTLAEYCDQHGCTPDQVDADTASRLADFVADRDWLNYDDATHCPGLCVGSDLHVYYLPDACPEMDRIALRPSSEDEERVRSIRESFPNYNEILDGVRSLDDLRKDLASIYPAIQTLWNCLAQDRDCDQPLEGNAADIVYAWCALALAAKEPFYMEDGPSTCHFTQLGKPRAQWQRPIERAARPSSPAPTGYIDRSVFDVDISGRLRGYKGHETNIVLPRGIVAIDCDVFRFTDIESIEIPEGVTEIEPDTFQFCDKLKTVKLPSTLRMIGDRAFRVCDNLTDINFPKDLETIGKEAFSDCESLHNVVFPSSLRSIGEKAFKGCGKLTDINILEGLETIGKEAHSDCESLQNVIFSSSLRSIGENAFQGCDKLTDEGIETIGKEAFIDCVSLQNVVFPSSIRSIGEKAFQGCGNLTDINFPEGLETIGKDAFCECVSLQNVVFPSLLRSIGEEAFQGCGNLTDINFPEGLETIGKDAFYECVSLQNVVFPSSLRSIGERAFSFCEHLVSVVMPEGCEEIGDKCFMGCSELEDVQLPASVKKIGHFALGFSEKLVVHTVRGSAAEEAAIEHCWNYDYALSGEEAVPVSMRPGNDGIQVYRNGCLVMGDYELWRCDSDQEVIVLPDWIKSIHEYAFSSTACEGHNYRKIVIPEGVVSIDEGAFYELDTLEDIRLPSTLKSIGKSAFNRCTALERITIPEGVESIDCYAFMECKKLVRVELPSTLKVIEDDTFYECSELSELSIPEGVESINTFAFGYCRNLTRVSLPGTLKVIGSMAFSNCSALCDLTIPEGVEIIEGYAFENCSALCTVKLPNTLLRIDEGAFSGCESLESIYVPASVLEIGENAFDTNCEDTVIYTVRGSVADAYAQENGLTVKYCMVSAEDAPFDALEDELEEDVEEAVEEDVEEAVEEDVEEDAVLEEDATEEDAVPEDVSGCIIDEQGTLTRYCGQQRDVVLPAGIRAIGEQAFSCQEIARVVIPEGVESIGDSAFAECGSLESVVFPSSLREIGDNAFIFCERLASVEIQEGTVSIGSYAFNYCGGLETVMLPGTLRSIGEAAFSWCGRLTRVAIPEGCEQIGAECFANCASLAEVSVPASVREIGSSAFGAPGGVVVHADAGSAAEAAAKAQGWKLARDAAEEAQPDARTDSRNDLDMVSMYVILVNERKLGQPERSDEDFCAAYAHNFAALTKSAIIRLKNDMLEQMRDESLGSQYAECFRQRSVADRFAVSTANLHRMSPEPEPVGRAEWALENTRDWYKPAEYAQACALMDAQLAPVRRQLDDQLRAVDPNWVEFSTGSAYLQLVIADRRADGSDLKPRYSHFQLAVGNQIVSVRIASRGPQRVSATVDNCFPWYWNVSVREIWEAALRNGVRDNRRNLSGGNGLVQHAMAQIRAQYPDPNPPEGRAHH